MTADNVMMPKKLPAENWAKSVLVGEFYEEREVECHECGGDDDYYDCFECGGSGVLIDKIQVSWTTIKAIYATAVAALGDSKSCQALKDHERELKRTK